MAFLYHIGKIVITLNETKLCSQFVGAVEHNAVGFFQVDDKCIDFGIVGKFYTCIKIGCSAEVDRVNFMYPISVSG